jgi:hypothetical protein
MTFDLVTLLEWLLPIPLALVYANFLEWGLHKYVLHGLGKKKSSFWSFHWHTHHQGVRRNGHEDLDYKKTLFQWNAHSKEVMSLVGIALLHLPLAYFSVSFVLTLLYSNLNYYRVHRKSHLDPQWARQNLSWHYDHHMGLNQDSNWCVTKPWADFVLGTREPYVGTEQELEKHRRASKPSSQLIGD